MQRTIKERRNERFKKIAKRSELAKVKNVRLNVRRAKQGIKFKGQLDKDNVSSVYFKDSPDNNVFGGKKYRTESKLKQDKIDQVEEREFEEIKSVILQ